MHCAHFKAVLSTRWQVVETTLFCMCVYLRCSDVMCVKVRETLWLHSGVPAC